MDDLKTETHLIEHRMVKGFYLGLDTEVRLPPTWEVLEDDARQVRAEGSSSSSTSRKVEFKGVWLDAQGETRHLPLGWITNPHQHEYTVSDDTSAAASSTGESR